MYVEFILIFVILGIILILLICNLLLLLKLLKRGRPTASDIASRTQDDVDRASRVDPVSLPTAKTVLCKNCSSFFDASKKSCPICGTAISRGTT